MHRKRSLLPTCTAAFLFFATLLVACKRAPMSPPAAVPAARPALDVRRLSEAQLVAANQQDGLGLGLRIDGSTFRTGAPIPMHIVLEDFAARTPIASGMCGGFFVEFEETSTHDSGEREMSNPHCFGADPDPDTIPLERGKLKIVNTDSEAAAHLSLDPGQYLFSLDWHAYPAGPGTIGNRDTYTELRSNAIPVTITP